MARPTMGALRHRVSIQTITRSAGSGATVSQSWSTDDTVWAQAEALSDQQRLALVNRGSGATHRFTIRHREPVTADKWLLFDGRRFKVLGSRDPDERRVYLEILAEEVRTA